MDSSQIGTYTITYTAEDSSGNVATVQKQVTVVTEATTGDLELTGYYASANGLTDNALILELRNIVTSTYVGKNYDYVKVALIDTDVDPNNPNNIIEFYTGQSISNVWNPNVTWNREHVWPQSKLGIEAGGTNAASDIHNLTPAYNSINSSRGNKFFDLHPTTTVSYYPERTDIHGDIARILFYMVIRYDIYSLVNYAPNVNEMGKLSTLLQWHLDDPVDAFEMRRNDRIEYHQGNRNPFIDYPELINYLNIAQA